MTFSGFAHLSAGPIERELRAEVQSLKETIAKLEQAPLTVFTIAALTSEGRGIAAGSPPVEISLPAGAKLGSQIRCRPETSQGYDLLPEPVCFGPVVEVTGLGDGWAVVKANAQEYFLPVADGARLTVGARAVLDNASMVVLKALEADEAGFAPSVAQSVSWDDIGGQDEAKEALREALEYPTLHAELYAAHGQKPAKGALLYGPPGTGKTLLAKALATSVGGDTAGFIYVKATEVMSRWQGQSGKTVRDLFKQGRDHQAKTGKRAILFIDEADSLLPVRDGGGVKVGAGVEDMVPVFLAEMDGLNELGPFVLLATNRPDRIDPAVLRDGRCETKVHVARPDQKACADIFGLALRSRRFAAGMVGYAATELFSDRLILLELTYPGVRTSEYLRLRDLVSGAMIEGIVQRAAGLAIKRDRESGELSAISSDDLEVAIKLTLRQQARLNHDAVIAEMSRAFGKSPERVRKVVEG